MNTEPNDYDEGPQKRTAAPRPKMNRAQTRAMLKWAKTPAGKKALARAKEKEDEKTRQMMAIADVHKGD